MTINIEFKCLCWEPLSTRGIWGGLSWVPTRESWGVGVGTGPRGAAVPTPLSCRRLKLTCQERQCGEGRGATVGIKQQLQKAQGGHLVPQAHVCPTALGHSSEGSPCHALVSSPWEKCGALHSPCMGSEDDPEGVWSWSIPHASGDSRWRQWRQGAYQTHISYS